MEVMRRGRCPNSDRLPVGSASQLLISWRYSSNEYDGLILHRVHMSMRQSEAKRFYPARHYAVARFGPCFLISV